MNAKRSEAVKQGIAAARAHGVDWGRAGRDLAARNAMDADEYANNLRPFMAELISECGWRPASLARKLFNMKVPTANGGRWRCSTTARLIERLGPSLKDDVAAALASGTAIHVTVWSYQQWLEFKGHTDCATSSPASSVACAPTPAS